VGRALRRYREGLGFTLDDAARTLECDRSKISRIETGQRGIRGKELRELLAEYGVAGEQQALLALLADPRGAFAWYRDYTSVLPGPWQDYLALETAATGIAAYDAQQVPGLLQLHQQVGSAAVMDEQIGALAEAAGDSGTVTVQILPFESGAHAAAGDGSLALLRFVGAPGLGLVHAGGIGGGVCLEGRDDLEAYARVFEQLRAFAFSPAQSALLLRGLIGD
jgi:transcriptional regulator with XRE-family HTH domain